MRTEPAAAVRQLADRVPTVTLPARKLRKPQLSSSRSSMGERAAMLLRLAPIRPGDIVSRIPARGHPAHTRMLEVELLADREKPDERLEARGSIVDLRKTGFVPMLNDIQSAGMIHHMQINLLVARDSCQVERVRVNQPYVAIEASESTCGESCRDPVGRLLGLEGKRLVAGFEKQVSKLFGGPLGCSHLLTLGQTMGRALPHAIAHERTALVESAATREPGERIFKRTVFVDGLVSDDAMHMELALQQADVSTTPRSRVEQPLERLNRQEEVQAHARVSMNGFTLERLDCQERLRALADLGSDDWLQWRDHSDEVRDLLGARIIPGLGSRLLAKFAERNDWRRTLDALLHLGPGFLQCVAALGDGWISQSDNVPMAAATLGGNSDACYMWRSEGALEQSRKQYLNGAGEPEGDGE